ncbi:MAG: hypothetical protein IPK15_27440 [Verrucomicrobia bacterium]|nr:hypothetical protein [Verrucomicrobiota bacterium]
MASWRCVRSGDIGNRYLTHLVGVLLWPLGWAVAALITQGFWISWTDPSLKFIDPTATFYQLQSSLGVAVLAFWIVFSTVAAPLVIQKVFTYGALAGGELIGGAVGSFVQTADTTARAAAQMAPSGLPLATAGAAGSGRPADPLSTAAGQGNAGAILTAGSGLPLRRSRGGELNDVTGIKLCGK